MPLPKVLITRPLEAASPLAEAVRQRGYDPVIDPLLEIVPLGFSPPTRQFDAALITSASALPIIARFLDKQTILFTVGAATAGTARQRGFGNVTCIGQTVEEAANHLAADMALAKATIVYFSGTHITHDVQVLMGGAGPAIVRVPVYVARFLPLEKTTIALLSRGEINWIVLFSRRTAEAFSMAVTAMTEQGWIRGTGLVCLSERTAQPLADLPWREIVIAPQPTAEALIAAMPAGA